MSSRHLPHPPPHYCCQLALHNLDDCTDREPDTSNSPSPASRGFWDPVRLDAASHPPRASNTPWKAESFTFMPVETPHSMSMNVCESEAGAASSPGPVPPHSRYAKPAQAYKYACTCCPASFERPSALDQHMRKHTGEKPFQCTACSMSFSIASNARRHSRNCPARAPTHSHVAQSRFPVTVLRGSESSHRPQALEDSALAANHRLQDRGRSLSTTSSSSTSKPWGDVQDRIESSIISPEPMSPFEYDSAGGIPCQVSPPSGGR